jgi:hypothetical protein
MARIIASGERMSTLSRYGEQYQTLANVLIQYHHGVKLCFSHRTEVWRGPHGPSAPVYSDNHR